MIMPTCIYLLFYFLSSLYQIPILFLFRGFLSAFSSISSHTSPTHLCFYSDSLRATFDASFKLLLQQVLLQGMIIPFQQWHMHYCVSSELNNCRNPLGGHQTIINENAFQSFSWQYLDNNLHGLSAPRGWNKEVVS